MSKRSNGEGTIFRRKDGRWCGAYYDENFKRRYVYGNTQAETRRKLQEKQDSVSKPNKPNFTLSDWVLEYLEKYKKNELKPSTYSSYFIVYRSWIQKSQIGGVSIYDITAEGLQDYYNSKVNEGYNSKTIRHAEVLINGALDKAVKLQYIPFNPNSYTTLPKKKKYTGNYLSKEEVQVLMASAKEDPLYPLVITAIYTGMRRGEITALKWENVNFDKEEIYVKYAVAMVYDELPDERGKRASHCIITDPKTKKSIRSIPMLGEVKDALLKQRELQIEEIQANIDAYHNQGLVFAESNGDILDPSRLLRRYHAFLKKYGIKKIRFHDLRHTYASLLIEADVSMKVVQELLGHSVISTSLDIYSHISEQKKEEAVSKMEQMLQIHKNDG